MSENPQLRLANEFVQFTDRNIFLTGKAGTGKTTFLHNLRKTCPKRIVVVAPTGVAAINAGGATIHSFFQLPFGPYVPDRDKDQKQSFQQRMGRDKINLIRSLDLLVIDEISMVRADTLDHIDEVLRRHRDRYKPFGGVQLLMIGDLHQLSPVIKDEEWMLLQPYYNNPYFFSSRALQDSQPVSIELKHIYRQSDETFISLLNSVRENRLDAAVLAKLNARYIPNFNPAEDEGYITLTSHNHTAKQINEVKLHELKGKTYQFKATVEGEFPEYSYPNDADLLLKEGAQVMFIKNDLSRDKRYYNGKIGKITRVIENTIFVKCPGEDTEIPVTRVEWANLKFELNTATKEIEEKQLGSFVQYPLRTAWAITIHKSQGLTFEKAIIDAQAAFAHGQVYVALSRCKSYEGMVLRTPINQSSVKTDGTVSQYTEQNEKNAPDQKHLDQSKQHFQQALLYELIDFGGLKRSLSVCKRLGQENDHVISNGFLDMINAIREVAERDIFAVADKFRNQLEKMMQDGEMPEDSRAVQERISSGCRYFADKLNKCVTEVLAHLAFDSDNKAVKKTITTALTQLRKEVFIKQGILRSSEKQFETLNYLKIKANAGIDFDLQEKADTETKPEAVAAGVKHPELYKQLNAWRNTLAQQKNVPVYVVMPQKVLNLIVNLLPSTLAELEDIKGMGKTRVKEYGYELMQAIDDYCHKKEISRTPLQQLVEDRKPQPPVKNKTSEISLELFRAGKSIEEIAQERGMTVGTIEGHLGKYVGEEIDIFQLVAPDKVLKIQRYIQTEKPGSTTDTKLAMGDDVSYGEIRAVLRYMEIKGI